MSESQQGLVHLYYGPGKGKSTAAMGLTARAVGHGKSVSVFQYMKGHEQMIDQYGEVKLYRDIDGISVEQFPAGHACNPSELSDEERSTLQNGLEIATDAAANAVADVIVLDEITALQALDVLDPERLVDIVQARDDSVELVITGREAPPEVVDIADYVTYMGEVKHPFQRGIESRKSIEY